MIVTKKIREFAEKMRVIADIAEGVKYAEPTNYNAVNVQLQRLAEGVGDLASVLHDMMLTEDDGVSGPEDEAASSIRALHALLSDVREALKCPEKVDIVFFAQNLQEEFERMKQQNAYVLNTLSDIRQKTNGIVT